MLLRDLFASLPTVALPELLAVRTVTGVEERAARVRPGSVFVAIPGFTVDGHQFVADAARRGAVAVVVRRGHMSAPPDWQHGACAWIEVSDTRIALSALAAAWHGQPARQLRVVGVTGTDGKTTTTFMTAAVLGALGEGAGLISTARIKVGGAWEENPTRQTSLEPLDVHAILARMRDAGDRRAVVEASSHGLALHKLDDCRFNVAVVTNITEDHLDFHQTRAAYWEAKARLLDLAAETNDTSGPRFAVLNRDDGAFGFLRSRARLPVFSFALDNPADLRGVVSVARPDGSRVHLSGRWGEGDLWLPMAGRFNVANALAATVVGLGHGLSVEAVTEALAGFAGVPGRMTRIDEGQPFTVLVDYAHTGHALAKLFAELRPLTRGRLIAVFGSAGEQSRERRAGLAEAAARYTDHVFITSEDPRREDPEAIIADIAGALADRGKLEGQDYTRIVDRREAIERAIAVARPGDVVALTGKGHEQSIIVGDTKLPWDEATVVRQAFRARGEAV